MLDKIKNYVGLHRKSLILLTVLIIAAGIYINNSIKRAEDTEQELKKAKSMTSEQAQNIDDLQNQLDISNSTAELLKKEIAAAQENATRPVASFTVQAADTTAAVNDVTEKINNNDSDLPAAAIEKTDQTIVADQPDNQDYQVGVYKINLKKNYYVGAGIGVNNGDVYFPVSMQRNYDKAHAIDIQANIDTQGKINGGQIMWKIGF